MEANMFPGTGVVSDYDIDVILSIPDKSVVVDTLWDTIDHRHALGNCLLTEAEATFCLAADMSTIVCTNGFTAWLQQYGEFTVRVATVYAATGLASLANVALRTLQVIPYRKVPPPSLETRRLLENISFSSSQTTYLDLLTDDFRNEYSHADFALLANWVEEHRLRFRSTSRTDWSGLLLEYPWVTPPVLPPPPSQLELLISMLTNKFHHSHHSHRRHRQD